jgi:hypothetical protein
VGSGNIHDESIGASSNGGHAIAGQIAGKAKPWLGDNVMGG